MNEDRCRVRAGVRALAALRNLVLWLIRSRGLSVPTARENLREERAEALAVVTGKNLSMALDLSRSRFHEIMHAVKVPAAQRACRACWRENERSIRLFLRVS